MSNFWPSGLELSDTQSPREILEVAQEDWYTSSQGIMELVLQDAEAKSGMSMIIVHAKHVPSNRTSRLLSVIHRPNNPYPVTFHLEDEDLPDYLKKSYTYSDLEDVASRLRVRVSNPWVSETPPEFRKNLANAFNLGYVKSRILNLASGASYISVVEINDSVSEITETEEENTDEEKT